MARKKAPKSFEGYDRTARSDVAHHSETLERAEQLQARIVEEKIKPNNPTLYALLHPKRRR